MLAASMSAQAQTYDPVEILPTDIPSVPAPSINPPTPTNLGDDATKEVDLGFTFNYFGQDFTKAWISSNGFVSFQSGAHLCCNGEPLEQAQRNTIYQYWTDLINWTGTPYYSKQTSQDGVSSLLVGWYGTYEYGGNRSTSFEMYLYDTGGITFNYIKTYDMQGHTVTAGLTGPTADDNILLFRGSNTSTLSGKAYSFNYETGTVTVDCSISLMDPSCISENINIPGVPSVTPDVTNTVTSAVETVQQTEQVATQEQQIVDTVEAAVQEQDVEQAIEQAVEQVIAEQVVAEQQVTSVAATASTQAAKETSSSAKSADRLNPTQLAALNSGGASVDAVQASSTPVGDSLQSGDASAKSSMQLFTNASNSSIAMADAEQQQQLQASMSSSVGSFLESTGANEQTVAQVSVQIAQGNSAEDTKVSVASSYTDQQKASSMDANKDQIASMQQILQADQIISGLEQQVSVGTTQTEEDKTSLTLVQIDSMQSSISSTESRWQESISSQSTTLEALNTISNQSNNSGESQESGSSLGEGQSEVISQMAYVAGFSAYKLVSLPDRPDFYKPRRIYKNNRPVDAYMSIFKMTAANDNLWKQMVESQYE